MTAELKTKLRAETGMRRLLEIDAAPADMQVKRSDGLTLETGASTNAPSAGRGSSATWISTKPVRSG